MNSRPDIPKSKLIKNEDGTFLVPINDTLCQHLDRGERWEPHYTKLLPLLLPEGSTAIDVGACIGYTSVALAKVVGESGRVFSFEPVKFAYRHLSSNIELNQLKNVCGFNVAIGHVNDVHISMSEVDYTQDGVNMMNTCIGIGGDIISMHTLDSYDFSEIALLKIDVQGFETYVLKGAEKTICENRPYILIEVEEQQLQNQSTSSIEVLTQLFVHDYILIRFMGRWMYDYVCIPREKAHVMPDIMNAIDHEVEVYEFSEGEIRQQTLR